MKENLELQETFLEIALWQIGHSYGRFRLTDPQADAFMVESVRPQWNKNNPDYFRANYLQKKLEGAPEPSCKEFSSQGCAIPPPQSRLKLELPHQVIQEVIGIQQLVIIEYLVQVLFRRFQEEIKNQIIENTG